MLFVLISDKISKLQEEIILSCKFGNKSPLILVSLVFWCNADYLTQSVPINTPLHTENVTLIKMFADLMFTVMDYTI